jgi:alpha,alpha-trehalase
MRDHVTLTELFHAVQTSGIFPDSKTFCDCIPHAELEYIQQQYDEEKGKAKFNLKEFVLAHFELPEKIASTYEADANDTVEKDIENLWPILLRKPDLPNQGTLLPLPFDYIVPGGRFGEVYYWDSYFTQLGLVQAGKVDLVEDMIKNFSHLIHTQGFIPNGNRSYYVGRSQPPFFALMVQLLASIKGDSIYVTYLPALQKEYDFWMNDAQRVELPRGQYLNRYWDTFTTPRPEAYQEDMELASESTAIALDTYRHIRAAAASGWDFSTRWFQDPENFASIHTTDIIPVDLNALLYMFEEILEKTYRQLGNKEKATFYEQAKEQRKIALTQFCWDSNRQSFFDYDFKANKLKATESLAMVFPLFANMASPAQAEQVKHYVEQHFLKSGGLVTTLHTSGQQWDSPNGWAPLQWVAVQGLLNYGYSDLAETIVERWLKLNRKVFARTGKMMEKYNVVDTSLDAGGGEYEGQDGFGWTNGVFLAMQDLLGKGM